MFRPLLLLASLSPAATLACQDPIAFPEEEAIALLEAIQAGDDLGLQAQFDYDRLLCADSQFLRDQARAIGRTSGIEAIQGAAIRSAIFEKDVLNLTILPAEGMSDAAIEMMDRSPIISYQVRFVDRGKGCLSFYQDDHCAANHLASLSGTEMDLRADSNVAKLRLTEDGRMVGIWANGNVNAPIRQQVELRLD
ncbi:MAG: hypothetical protein AAF919_05080 [Pseudomonadota bacterium]